MTSTPQPNRPTPSVFMWLDRRCNLQCNHCNIWKNKGEEAKLSIADRKVIVGRLFEHYGVPLTINFLGGELLLSPDELFELIAHCAERGIQTSVTTNGTLIDARKARRIVDAGLTHLSFSIDSYAPPVHDLTRGVEGTHARALRGLEAVKAERNGRPKVYVNSIIMRQNLEELPELVQWTSEQELDGISFQPIAPPHLFAAHKVHGAISRYINATGLDALMERFRRRDERWFDENDFWPEPGDAIRILRRLLELKSEGLPVTNTGADLERFIQYFTDPDEFLRAQRCTACESVTISPEGELKHCLGQPSLGDARLVSIGSRLESPEAAASREHVADCNRSCKILSINKDDFYF